MESPLGSVDEFSIECVKVGVFSRWMCQSKRVVKVCVLSKWACQIGNVKVGVSKLACQSRRVR